MLLPDLLLRWRLGVWCRILLLPLLLLLPVRL
jgi:hypothetical protein